MNENFYIFLRKIANLSSSYSHFKLFKTLFRRLFRFTNLIIQVADFDENLKIKLKLSEHMQRRIFWMGYYSENIIALLKHKIKPEMTVIDIGANIGEITLVSAKIVGNNGRVISFEPVNSIAEKLEEHVKINNLSQVKIIREGLADKIQNNIPIYSSCGQEVSDEHNGLASLYGQEEGKLLQYININTLDHTVEMLNLERIDLIKIDIEGGELPCLYGAQAVLDRFKPMLIVEVQEFSAKQAGWETTELFEFLKNFGYKFYIIEKNGKLKSFNSKLKIDFENIFCCVDNIDE